MSSLYNGTSIAQHVIRVGYWEICALETQMTTDKAASQIQALCRALRLKDKAIISYTTFHVQTIFDRR